MTFRPSALLPIICSLMLMACSSTEERPPTNEKPPAENLSVGKRKLSEEKFDEALEQFNLVLKNQTTTPEIPYAYFYSGVALQELNRCPEAIDRFRKFFGMATKDPLLPHAFYRLGLCYETLDDKGAAVAAFLDALNRVKAHEPLRAELQARLAGLYAQLGNEQEAQRLYELAEGELLALRRQHPPKEVPSWLAKTLYNMGKMSTKPIKAQDYEGSMRSYEKAQIWLLRLARLNDRKWSQPASVELVKIYNDAWKVIEEVPLYDETDKLLAMKDQQDRKIGMAVSLYNLYSKLKLERGYDFSNENENEKFVFDSLAPIEEKLELLLKSRPVEQSLTPAALEREGLKRRGKMIPVDMSKLPKKKER